MKFRIRNIVVVLMLVAWANAKPVNLVLHKDAILSPKPNYDLTMDPLDRKQLTDGVMGEHEDTTLPNEGSHPKRVTRIVCEG